MAMDVVYTDSDIIVSRIYQLDSYANWTIHSIDSNIFSTLNAHQSPAHCNINSHLCPASRIYCV